MTGYGLPGCNVPLYSPPKYNEFQIYKRRRQFRIVIFSAYKNIKGKLAVRTVIRNEVITASRSQH